MTDDRTFKERGDSDTYRFRNHAHIDALRMWLVKERYAEHPREWVVRQRKAELQRHGIDP
jgi:hypothetical protein